MGSHTTRFGIPLTIGKRGIVFSKKPSRFNNCIGDKMRGHGGSREGVKTSFTSAAAACGGRRSARRARRGAAPSEE